MWRAVVANVLKGNEKLGKKDYDGNFSFTVVNHGPRIYTRKLFYKYDVEPSSLNPQINFNNKSNMAFIVTEKRTEKRMLYVLNI